MKAKHIYLALGLLIIFPLARTMWFYQGFYRRPAPVETPNFTRMEIVTPEIKTAEPAQVNADDHNNVVLIDTDHDNLFLMSDIESLTDTLVDMGTRVEINSDHSLKDQLKYARAYVVISPNLTYSIDEIESIVKFVERGGRMMVINDPARSIYEAYGSTAYMKGLDITNLLLQPFDIAFQNDYVYNLLENEGNYRNIYLDLFSNGQMLTKDLSQIVFYGAHSLETSQTILISGDDATLTSLDDQSSDLALAALTHKGDGSVLVLGDINFFDEAYYQVADNHRFIQNIAGFLTSGTRKQVLEDIPYLFNRPVTILTDPDTSIDNDLLETLTSTQNYLDSLNLSLEISEEPIDGNDLLILGTFPPDDELAGYLESFDIEFNINNSIYSNGSDDTTLFFDEEPSGENDGDTATAGLDLTAIAKETQSAQDETDEESAEGSATPSPDDDESILDDHEDEDSIYMPGLGKFAAKGIGLVLFTSQEERNTLILLTASTRSLGDFTYNILNYSDLSGCLIKRNVAVCNIDSSFADYEDYDESDDDSDNSDDSDSEFDFFDDSDLDDEN